MTLHFIAFFSNRGAKTPDVLLREYVALTRYNGKTQGNAHKTTAYVRGAKAELFGIMRYWSRMGPLSSSKGN